jgi:hypothetical protein
VVKKMGTRYDKADLPDINSNSPHLSHQKEKLLSLLLLP